MAVYWDEEWPLDTEISIYARHPSRSMWNRLRLAWQALKGEPYTDMMILDEKATGRLISALQRVLPRAEDLNGYTQEKCLKEVE